MAVNLVADVGNSRIKWGVCASDGGRPAVIRRAWLEDSPADWEGQLARWKQDFPFLKTAGTLMWAVAGVQPQRCERLCEWIVSHGHRVMCIHRHDGLPVQVDVDAPERVGLDRLLNAVAARTQLPPGQPAVLVDAGSAVTVDWLDEKHVFCGGAIFPGNRMMARALHKYTALLPEVRIGPPGPMLPPALPGRSTEPAMQAGVFWAVLGGIEAIARGMARAATRVPHVFLTGGDMEWMVPALDGNDRPPWLDGFTRTLWPEQTLVGVLLSAEVLTS
jgi:type III pantothenate kinase